MNFAVIISQTWHLLLPGMRFLIVLLRELALLFVFDVINVCDEYIDISDPFSSNSFFSLSSTRFLAAWISINFLSILSGLRPSLLAAFLAIFY